MRSTVVPLAGLFAAAGCSSVAGPPSAAAADLITILEALRAVAQLGAC